MKLLPERQVILTDARDLDPGEKVALGGSNVRHIAETANLLNSIPATGRLYIHFDVDLVNPEDAPAMGYAATGGPSAEALDEIFRALAANGSRCCRYLLLLGISSWIAMGARRRCVCGSCKL